MPVGLILGPHGDPKSSMKVMRVCHRARTISCRRRPGQARLAINIQREVDPHRTRVLECSLTLK